jgi:hypothetical protein
MCAEVFSFMVFWSYVGNTRMVKFPKHELLCGFDVVNTTEANGNPCMENYIVLGICSFDKGFDRLFPMPLYQNSVPLSCAR